MRVLAIFIVLLLGMCAAQEIPLGDLARQERARREADELANFKMGTQPPVVQPGDRVPAHFLLLKGQAGEGEFELKINDAVIFHNSYVRNLPLYVSTRLLDGGNVLEVSMMTTTVPLDVSIEERYPGEEHKVLAQFHADASATPTRITKQIRFIAHPKMLAPIELTDADRAAIIKLIASFYDSLKGEDPQQVLALFAPGIEEARSLYPEGADFAQKQMTKMADVVKMQGFTMEPFHPEGLVMKPQAGIIAVSRADGAPIFSSNEVSLPGGGKTSISADMIPVKKIDGQWRLTLPFGF